MFWGQGRCQLPSVKRHVVSDEQFLTSHFCLAFTSFHTSLNFLRGPPGPLRTPGPGALAPATPLSRWAWLLYPGNTMCVLCNAHRICTDYRTLSDWELFSYYTSARLLFSFWRPHSHRIAFIQCGEWIYKHDLRNRGENIVGGNEATSRRLDAFDQWCLRRIFRIPL